VLHVAGRKHIPLMLGSEGCLALASLLLVAVISALLLCSISGPPDPRSNMCLGGQSETFALKYTKLRAFQLTNAREQSEVQEFDTSGLLINHAAVWVIEAAMAADGCFLQNTCKKHT